MVGFDSSLLMQSIELCRESLGLESQICQIGNISSPIQQNQETVNQETVCAWRQYVQTKSGDSMFKLNQETACSFPDADCRPSSGKALQDFSSPALPSSQCSNGLLSSEPQLSLESIQALEQRFPLAHAAAALGVSPAELRRACRRLGIARWRHRAHAAAAAAIAAPELRTVAYAANLRRRYDGCDRWDRPARG